MANRNPNKPITKISLYAKAMKVLLIIGVIVVIIFIALFIVSHFLYRNNSLIVDVLHGVVAAILLYLPALAPGSLRVLPGILRIGKQEKYFGIKFKDEMRKEKNTQTEYVSQDWFVDVRKFRIIVFKRGYISEILSISDCDMLTSRAVALLHNGERIKITGHYEAINNLQKWCGEKTQKHGELNEQF